MRLDPRGAAGLPSRARAPPAGRRWRPRRRAAVREPRPTPQRQLIGADDEDLALTVTVADGPTWLLLTLPDGPDVRSRIGALLTATPAGLPDEGVGRTHVVGASGGRRRTGTGEGTGGPLRHLTAAETAKGNDADIAFLAGMKRHHQQAVEMSDMVLAADRPPTSPRSPSRSGARSRPRSRRWRRCSPTSARR